MKSHKLAVGETIDKGSLSTPESLDVAEAAETEEIILDLLGDDTLTRIPYSSTYPETEAP